MSFRICEQALRRGERDRRPLALLRSGSGPSSISPSSPRTPLIGVRISWLIAARKRDFATVAASASSRRRFSSACRSTSAVTSQISPTRRREPSCALVERRHVADVAHLAVRPHDAVLARRTGRCRSTAALRLGHRPLAVVGVQRAGPVGLAEEARAVREAEERLGPLVPEQLVGARGRRPRPRPARRRARTPAARTAATAPPRARGQRELGLARRDQPRRAEDRRRRRAGPASANSARGSQAPRRAPAALRDRRDLPGAERQRRPRPVTGSCASTAGSPKKTSPSA